IRDRNVTGVQTCALPISSSFLGEAKQFQGEIQVWLRGVYEIEYLINGDFYNNGTTTVSGGTDISAGIDDLISVSFSLGYTSESRSEERRVGKERWCRGVK